MFKYCFEYNGVAVAVPCAHARLSFTASGRPVGR